MHPPPFIIPKTGCFSTLNAVFRLFRRREGQEELERFSKLFSGNSDRIFDRSTTKSDEYRRITRTLIYKTLKHMKVQQNTEDDNSSPVDRTPL